MIAAEQRKMAAPHDLCHFLASDDDLVEEKKASNSFFVCPSPSSKQ
jgi:hypothetical protein